MVSDPETNLSECDKALLKSELQKCTLGAVLDTGRQLCRNIFHTVTKLTRGSGGKTIKRHYMKLQRINKIF